MRISYSNLELYRACPYLFKHIVRDKNRLPKVKEMVFGSAVHNALRYMFTRNPLYPTLDEISDHFGKVWAKHAEKIELKDEKEAHALLESGLSLLKRFWLKNQPWNFDVLDLESRFEVDIKDPVTYEKHTLVGIIDRVDKIGENAIRIIDYKTSRKMPSQDAVSKNLQLSLYNLGLIKRWPHFSAKKIKLTLSFLQHGEELTTERSPDELKKTEEELLGTINEISARIKTNDWPALSSPLCARFPYNTVCPMWRHLHQIKNEQISDSGAGVLIEEYIGLKNSNQNNNKRLGEIQALLSAYMDERGLMRLFGDEGYITKTLKSSNIYDFDKVREILEPIGKWSEILRVDERKFAKLIPFLPEDAQKKLVGSVISIKNSQFLAFRKKKFG